MQWLDKVWEESCWTRRWWGLRQLHEKPRTCDRKRNFGHRFRGHENGCIEHIDNYYSIKYGNHWQWEVPRWHFQEGRLRLWKRGQQAQRFLRAWRQRIGWPLNLRGFDPQALHLNHLQAFQWAHAKNFDAGWPDIAVDRWPESASPSTFHDLRADGRYQEAPNRRGSKEPSGI